MKLGICNASKTKCDISLAVLQVRFVLNVKTSVAKRLKPLSYRTSPTNFTRTPRRPKPYGLAEFKP